MLVEDEGIVLRSWPLGEADGIFSILTRSHGKIRVAGKGIKKNRLMRAALSPLTRGRFICWEGKGELGKISSASALSPFGLALSSTYPSYLAACLMAEVADKLLETSQGEEESYLLLWGALSALAKRRMEPWKIVLSFELRILACAGWSPAPFGCAACGREGDFLSFSPARGGWVCERCACGREVRYSEAQKAQFCALLCGDWGKVGERDPAVEGLVRGWVNYYLDRNLNSEKVIREKI
ncbi:MAG: DNA repair protein RecO [Aeriscardovia sp.]|nr:DNA repair protein RecO [Aeriscardovia sp.]